METDYTQGTLILNDDSLYKAMSFSSNNGIIFEITQDGILKFGEHITPRDAALAIEKAWLQMRGERP